MKEQDKKNIEQEAAMDGQNARQSADGNGVQSASETAGQSAEEDGFQARLRQKRDEYAKKAEDNLNAMPVEQRKKVFFYVFGGLALMVVLKFIFSCVVSCSSDNDKCAADEKPKTEKTVTEKDVLDIDLYVEPKVAEEKRKGLENMIKDIRREDSARSAAQDKR